MSACTLIHTYLNVSVFVCQSPDSFLPLAFREDPPVTPPPPLTHPKRASFPWRYEESRNLVSLQQGFPLPSPGAYSTLLHQWLPLLLPSSSLFSSTVAPSSLHQWLPLLFTSGSLFSSLAAPSSIQQWLPLLFNSDYLFSSPVAPSSLHQDLHLLFTSAVDPLLFTSVVAASSLHQ
jgi:hypothetical protein